MNMQMEFGVAALLTLSGAFMAVVMFVFCIILLFRPRSSITPGSEAGLVGLTLISAGICVAAMPYAVVTFMTYGAYERMAVSAVGAVLMVIGLYLLMVLANPKSTQPN